MDPKLHYLCSSSLQSTDQLYGDTIIKDIKDAQEFNKISRQVGMRGRGVRGRVEASGVALGARTCTTDEEGCNIVVGGVIYSSAGYFTANCQFDVDFLI